MPPRTVTKKTALGTGLIESMKIVPTTITSFNGDYIGYVILPRYYHLGGYEPRLMSFYGPCVPDYFEELIRTMASEMINKQTL